MTDADPVIDRWDALDDLRDAIQSMYPNQIDAACIQVLTFARKDADGAHGYQLKVETHVDTEHPPSRLRRLIWRIPLPDRLRSTKDDMRWIGWDGFEYVWMGGADRGKALPGRRSASYPRTAARHVAQTFGVADG